MHSSRSAALRIDDAKPDFDDLFLDPYLASTRFARLPRHTRQSMTADLMMLPLADLLRRGELLMSSSTAGIPA